MQFRIAARRDAECIAALHAESWRRTYRGMMPDAFLDGPILSNRLEAWQARLDDDRPEQWICLALDACYLVGFICVLAQEDETWGACVDNLHVVTNFHRKGIGAGLMLQAGEWLSRKYAQSGVYLWAMEANEPARRFYERLGGRNVETMLKPDPGGGTAPNCRYAWASPAAVIEGVDGVMPFAEGARR